VDALEELVRRALPGRRRRVVLGRLQQLGPVGFGLVAQPEHADCVPHRSGAEDCRCRTASDGDLHGPLLNDEQRLAVAELHGLAGLDLQARNLLEHGGQVVGAAAVEERSRVQAAPQVAWLQLRQRRPLVLLLLLGGKPSHLRLLRNVLHGFLLGSVRLLHHHDGCHPAHPLPCQLLLLCLLLQHGLLVIGGLRILVGRTVRLARRGLRRKAIVVI